MKILFIGSIEFSKRALLELMKLGADVIGVITKEKPGINADFVDLSDICKINKISYRYAGRDINSEENIKWIEKLGPDIIFCIGFSQLLKERILGIAPMGIIGFHPAKLPENRGRHPVIWALVRGLKKTTSTFFFIDNGVDSGDILSQIELPISYEDNAATLYDKIMEIALRQIKDFLPKLQHKTFERAAQDQKKAGYLRKRGMADGKIDFSAGSRTAYNLIRALTHPYAGAHVLWNNKEIKVWSAKEMEIDSKNINDGKVLDVKGHNILVKCEDGAILITEHDFAKLPRKGDLLK